MPDAADAQSPAARRDFVVRRDRCRLELRLPASATGTIGQPSCRRCSSAYLSMSSVAIGCLAPRRSDRSRFSS